MNIVPLPLPWLELAIGVALVGALWVSRFRDPLSAWRWGLAFAGASFACTLVACAGFYLCESIAGARADLHWTFQGELLGRRFLGVDELNAPLLPLVGLLHFLTA